MKPKAWRPPSTVFHAITHVWGREYLDTFLNWCLPNQLEAGNVDALPPGSRYRIQTRAIHVAELDVHPMVNALRAAIPVDIVVVEELDRRMGVTRGHELMITCHQEAVTSALDANAAVMFLSADFIFSKDAFAAVVRRHREGYRAVVNTGLRLAREPFLRSLAESHAPHAALPPRELVRRAMPHLHSHTRSMFVDARPFSIFPVAAYWRVGEEGLVARCLHLHPLMVDPMRALLPRGSNDGHYLRDVCPDFSRVHVVADSDELQMFELTPADRPVVASRGDGASVWRTAAVAAMCDELQVRHWSASIIRLHSSDCDHRWASAAAASDAFAKRVLRLQPYGRTARDWFLFLERFRKRRHHYRRALQRRLPRITLKRALRPLRLGSHWSSKAMRKGTRRVLRQVGVR